MLGVYLLHLYGVVVAELARLVLRLDRGFDRLRWGRPNRVAVGALVGAVSDRAGRSKYCHRQKDCQSKHDDAPEMVAC
jgi:hypothetical protein